MKRDTIRLIAKYEIATSCKHYGTLEFNKATEHFYEIPICKRKQIAFSHLLTSKPCVNCRLKRCMKK